MTTDRAEGTPRAGAPAWTIVAGTLYFVACVCVATQFATWTDEEYTLATTAHGPAYALTRAVTYELQAPLYFVVLAVWREVDGAVWFARLFSIVCATGFFFVLAAIGRRIAPERNPLPFALLGALSPFVLAAAFEIRLYSLALLLTGAAWLACDDGFLAGSSRRARIAFVALIVAGAYVQYFLAFALCGFGVAVLVVRRSAFGAYAFYACLAALAVVPLAVAAHEQVGGYAIAGPPLWQLLRVAAIHPLLDFVFPYPGTWNPFPAVRALYYALVGAAVALVIWGKPRLDRPLLALVACAAGVELTYLVVIAVLRMHLEVRYFVALYVPTVAAAYGIFAAVRRGPRPWTAVAFLPVLMGLAIAAGHYRFLAVSGDWKRVSAFLESNAKPGDVIAVFPPDAMPAFARQYRGAVPAVPFPHGYSTQVYSVANLTLGSRAQARDALRRIAGHTHVWLVAAGQCYFAEPAFGCNVISQLAHDVPPVARRSFFQSEVYEFEGASVGRAQTRPHRVRQIAPTRNDHLTRGQSAQP